MRLELTLKGVSSTGYSEAVRARENAEERGESAFEYLLRYIGGTTVQVSRSLDQSQSAGGATAANWSHKMALCLSLALSSGPLAVWRLVLRFPWGCCESHGDWPVLGGYREGLGQ